MSPSTSELIAFLGATDPDRATTFYRDTLGLNLVPTESPSALVFETGQTTLRISIVDEVRPAPYTVLGWSVDDIDSAVRSLSSNGVSFDRIPEMDQDDRGIWTAPDGTKVAWFRDPDDNVLSVTEHASG